MSYVKTINEDGTVSDIMAKALDPTLGETLVHTSDVTTATNVTTAGKVADARAIKTVNDKFKDVPYNGELSGTIDDNTIATGLYTLLGASATGTFPSNNAKYAVLLVINRSDTGYQTIFTADEVYTRSVSASNLTAAWTSHYQSVTVTSVEQTENIAAGFAAVTCTEPSGTYAAKILLSAYVRTSADVTLQGLLPSSRTARFYNGGSALSNAVVVSSWLLVN